jgi:hypothetical protein
MRVLAFRAIAILPRNELIVLRVGGQAMRNNLTSLSVSIAMAAGAVYHIAVLAAVAAVLG